MVNTELNNGTTRRKTLTVAALALASMAVPSALKFFQGSTVTKEEKRSPDHELNIISLGLKESQICAILAARGEHKTMQDVAISQGAPHGSNLCLKSDVVKAICKQFSAEIPSWPIALRVHLASYAVVELSRLGLTESDLRDPSTNLVDRARNDSSISEGRIPFNHSTFKAHSNRMLVICANEDEMTAFSNKIKQDGYRYKETMNSAGFKEYSSDDSKLHIQVITKDTLASKRHKIHTAGIVQCKGHTGDMISLLDSAKSHYNPSGCIGIFGGCNSENFMAHFIKAGIAPFTTNCVGQSAKNDYIALQLLSLMNDGKHNINKACDSLRQLASGTSKDFNFPDAPITRRVYTLVEQEQATGK